MSAVRRALLLACALAVPLAATAEADVTGPSAAAATRWTPTMTTASPSGHQAQLAGFADGTVFALADGPQVQPDANGATGVGVLRSRDGGASWRAPLAQPAFSGLPVLAMADASRGLFASGGLLSRTDDAAESWQQLALPTTVRDGGDYTTAASVLPGGRVAALAKDGFEVQDGCPLQLRTTPLQLTADGGRTWRTARLPFTSVPTDVQLVTARRAVVTAYPYAASAPVREGSSCSVGGGTLRDVVHVVTDDAGRTWRTALRCVAPCVAGWADPTTLVVVRADGSVLRSTDAGRRFVRTGSLPAITATGPTYVHAVDWLSSRVGYAAVYGAGTFRTTDGGRTWALDRSEPEASQVGSFADVVAVDVVRAVAASTTGLHARGAGPLAALPVGGQPAREQAAEPAATVDGVHRVLLDGTLRLPRRTVRA